MPTMSNVFYNIDQWVLKVDTYLESRRSLMLIGVLFAILTTPYLLLRIFFKEEL